MNIGIDARMYGLENAGIGRYVMNLVDRLVQNADYHWTLFLPPKYIAKFAHLPKVKPIVSSIRHYSLAEQTQFLRALNREPLDLLHVPHFNLPLLYNRPFVVTIHDILWHQVKGGQVTTLSPLVYYLKYLGYRLTINHSIHQAQAIFVPSNYVKQDLITTFSIPKTKIHVTYEGVEPPACHRTVRLPSNRPNRPLAIEPSALHRTARTACSSSNRPLFTEPPFLLYVGSAYPHKNLQVILQALTQLDYQLKIVGSRSVFLDRVQAQAQGLGVLDKVEFLGYQTDQQLVKLMGQALALVHPSKSEGFGLTGLEAMAAGCPVISAQASALPEIYGDSALFFDPNSPSDLIAKINQLQKAPELRRQLIAKGKVQVKKYSWDKMVSQTVKQYETCLSL